MIVQKERLNIYERFANRQVALADVIVVNKIDLVSEEEKAKVLSLVRYVILNDFNQ
jgi:G3E family GTPase